MGFIRSWAQTLVKIVGCMRSWAQAHVKIVGFMHLLAENLVFYMILCPCLRLGLTFLCEKQRGFVLPCVETLVKTVSKKIDSNPDV